MVSTNYGADSITILEGLKAVRLRPGMYIGSTGTKGLNHLVYEIVDNSVDEHMAGYCNKIKVILNKDGSCTVEDNGRGVPVEMHAKGLPAARIIFTTLHAGGKFDDKTYAKSGGLHGVGSSVVNALSEWMKVSISRDGKIYQDTYEQGVPTTELTKKGLLPTIGKSEQTGTTVTFLPDATIFESGIRFKAEEIKKRLRETCYLNPKLVIEFIDERADEVESIVYHEPEGIVGFVKALTNGSEVIHEPICYNGTIDNIEVEIAFQYADEFKEDIYGFCNNIYNSEGGTHISGFKNALTTTLNQYAKQIGVLKPKDENFTGNEIRNGMTAVIAVKHPDPRFEGQTKTKLDNQDAGKVTAKITNEQITLFFDRNLEILKKVLNQAVKAVRVKNNETKAKSDILSKKNFVGNGKLSNCESKDSTINEIFIVEGDSAGGSAKQGRNRKHQAILPIRGKILNVEKADENKMIQNAEIQTMVSAFGCGFGEGYGNDFHLEGLNYNKIIIMTDADVDGAHIQTLLLTFFYRHMKPLIEAGHIYIANPPLYKVTYKNKTEYLYNDVDLANYRKGKQADKIVMQRYKGLGEMNPEQLWETTMNPSTRKLYKVSIEDALIASKLTSTLMGDKVELRREYIFEHYNEADVDSSAG